MRSKAYIAMPARDKLSGLLMSGRIRWSQILIVSDLNGIHRECGDSMSEKPDKPKQPNKPEFKQYQIQAVAALHTLPHKRFLISSAGTGKTAIAMRWLQSINRPNILFVTTPSVRDSSQIPQEAVMWNGEEWLPSHQRFEVVSWATLARWVEQNRREIECDPSSWAIVFDECLPADTPVQTDKGLVQIADLKIGDKVLSYNEQTRRTEYKKIIRLIKKPSPAEMYRLRFSNGAIISTGNHPHYTQRGWVNASEIKVGDTLYELCNMPQTNNSAKRKPKTQTEERKASLLWLRLRYGRQYKKLSSTQQKDGTRTQDKKIWGICSVQPVQSKDVYERPEPKTDKRYGWQGKNLLQSRMCQITSGRGFPIKNETRQSVIKIRCNGESFSDEKGERNTAYMGGKPQLTRRQRALYRAADYAMAGTMQEEQRLGDGTTCEFEGVQNRRLPYMLQARYRKHLLQNRNRVRWGQPQLSRCKEEGREKGEEIRGVRVESIEILQQEHIRECKLYRDTDNVYCIDVEDNHNFFANGILTHNCHKGKAGIRSKQGKAFLKLTHIVDDWIGMTATPGDRWIDFQAYAVATNLVRNLTEFKRRFCLTVTYRGFEDIIGYQNENELDAWWKANSHQLDPNMLAKELPPRIHHIVQFPAPKSYKKTIKTSLTPEGEFLDTASSMRHWCRRACSTDKARATWITDFIESLDSPAVFFTNYDCEDEMIAKIHHHLHPKAKCWFINGKKHDIPTADTIGKHDIVVAKYPSGAEGLNLQFMHYCVLVSPNDSYSVSDQVRGRIRRHGQTMPQQYYYLQAKGTVEMAIYKALKNKSDFNWDRWEPKKDLE